MKKICSLLLVSFSLFGAKIGVVPWNLGDPYIAPFLEAHLTPLGHRVELIWKDADFDSYDLLVCSNTKSFLKDYQHKMIVSTFEPPVSIHNHEHYDEYRKFLCVFTWHHDICDGNSIKKFYYPCEHIQNLCPSDLLPFNQRKLACMVNSHLKNSHPNELYTSRKKICKYYRKYHPSSFSLYGKRGWEQGFDPIFKGVAEDKDKVLKEHKFNYCFENWLSDTYYISEKIFESFNSLCVPIYLGSSKITQLIPKETFIDANQFSSMKDLHSFLVSMNEETYMSYIHAIIKFNQSSTPELFSWEHHQKSVLDEILMHL